MKHLLFVFFLFFYSYSQAQILKNLKDVVSNNSNGEANFTQQEAGKAIIEALQNGATKGVAEVSKLDGFLGNPEIKIPFPKEVSIVETKLRAIGMEKLVDDAVTSINRAAEDASVEAKEIFISSIKQLTFKDAIEIIRGEENAATQYLQKTTSDSLNNRFRPIIANSLEKVNATKYWDDVMSRYNQIPFTKKVNEDLTGYATEKAIEGLFVMIAKEELKIRENPIARTSDLLKKVFGGGKE